MRSYPNIETKSWKRRGSDNAPLYVGYAHGTVWHCVRSGRSWRADCIARDFHKVDGNVAIHADTLRELSDKLEAVKLKGEFAMMRNADYSDVEARIARGEA